MCALFDYAGYAAARAPVKAKKKRDLSSFHTYAVLPCLGGGEAKIDLNLFSLHFGMAEARPPVETKKKQDISSFHTYAVFLSLDLTLPSLLARPL